MFKRSMLATVISLSISPTLVLANQPSTLDKMLIIGTSEEAKNLAGSGAVVDNTHLKTEASSDINQVLKAVPGVYILEEEGSGLRPNIGIRGATSERSQNITLLEDGVMMAPAPYAAPSAYYFPTTLRMDSIEVLKGAPLLRFGPQTTGGIVNLVSTPIPDSAKGSLTVSTGNNSSRDLHVNYGNKVGEWSWLLETVQRGSQGFKEIDNSNRDSGYDISDYVMKLGWEASEGPRQSLLFKAQRSMETSNETYLGLTDADFNANPNRRYGLSSIDQMNNDHSSFSALHKIALNDDMTLSTTLYRNEFARDWFKLSGGGSYIDLANAGDATAQGILDGTSDINGLKYKHNNREYYSQGLEFNLDWALDQHALQLGGRIHKDEVDRFQVVENYNQINRALVFDGTTQPGSSNNRIGSAEAQSLWLQDDWQVTEQLNTVLSLRYEDIESKEVRYSSIDRSTAASEKNNRGSEWLPGMSFTYDINEKWQGLAGVHRGFSPLSAGSADNLDPETSTNWELGARFKQDSFFAELIGFYSDFSSKIEHCSVGSTCSNGADSGSFKTGEAVIKGLELQAGTTFNFDSVALPVSLSYTYTQAENTANNVVSGSQQGDRLKDVPENIASLRVGLEQDAWNNYVVAKYIDEMCVKNGCNRSGNSLEKTQDLFVVDLISRYTINDSTETFIKFENLFDTQKIVSRSPDGARPNKPLTLTVGMTVSL
jgi:Fe(3+) dicitrate transport protein